ncbi:MAG TPA: FkbM family methyltransferase [Chthoniobacterales bacterium]|nr:FkbM family methyltransferase [Chthoniobacterales bacterium]
MPPTLDRWLALQAHRCGLMGADDIQYLKRFVRPDWRIGDIGANQGVYTLFFSSLARLGYVYAFEPDPCLFASLEENVRRNGANNVRLFEAAAARHATRLSLQPGLFNRGDNQILRAGRSSTGTIDVEAISLDEAIPEQRLDLLKIDVQGYEVEVLKGAQRILEINPHLLIYIEFWPHGLRKAGSDPEEMLDILHKAGFSLSRHVKALEYEPFTYRTNEWTRTTQFCNLIAGKASAGEE